MGGREQRSASIIIAAIVLTVAGCSSGTEGTAYTADVERGSAEPAQPGPTTRPAASS